MFYPKCNHFCKQIQVHCVKSVRIRSFSGPYFPACGLNTKRYGVSLRIHSECRKMLTGKTPNMDTFLAVVFYLRFKRNYSVIPTGINNLRFALVKFSKESFKNI